jgi:hypothetical protein
MELESSLACSQEFAAHPCPEPDASSSHPHVLFFKIHFNIIFPFTLIYFKSVKITKYLSDIPWLTNL